MLRLLNFGNDHSILKVRYIVPLVAVITAVLASLVFLAEMESLTSVLQAWLVAVIVVSFVAIMSSKVVRQARRWYGVDWWMAVISSTFLVGFLIMGIIPEYLAPYEPDESVAPKFLAPGETPPDFILILRNDLPFNSFEDIARQIVVNDDGSFELGEVTERASQANGVGRISAESGVVIGTELERLNARNQIAISRDLEENQPPDTALALLRESNVTGRRPLVAIVGTRDEFSATLQNYGDEFLVVDDFGPEYPTPILGTNNLGYDVFSRMIHGTRTTLITGIASALFACFIGIPLGLISGYVGGALDRALSLVLDSIYSFPGLILAIAIAVVLGRGITTVIFAIAVIFVPVYFRIVRSQTLAIREMAYVEAARSLGETDFNILVRYIAPNILASVVVIFSINVADAILTGAGLSFLSLGLPENTADWGVDLARNQQYLRSDWWLVGIPGFLITLLVLCFSLLGESLSEILNPRLNRS
jgi:peptide/nickel transport system permease protein